MISENFVQNTEYLMSWYHGASLKYDFYPIFTDEETESWDNLPWFVKDPGFRSQLYYVV